MRNALNIFSAITAILAALVSVFYSLPLWSMGVICICIAILLVCGKEQLGSRDYE